MRKVILHTTLTVCQENELSEQQRRLVEMAKQKTQDAYAPYSHFCVGAAALLADGQIVTGTNQENAAYPSGLCAERTTLFAANAQYPDQPVLALAIAARKGRRFLRVPISPCGACRQVISGVEERFGHPVRILLYGTEGVYECGGVDALLPLRFVDADMHL
ncbi:MAG TPA: cytidine deaminase [Prevotellaceae bacterium]|nr:cytidine deaminase [Prevotellaceae bacterium]